MVIVKIIGKNYIFTIERMFAIMMLHSSMGRGVKGMENQVHDGTYHDEQVNIPIQLLSITDRDGKITPLWFRLETEEHEIRKFRIEDIISRSEKKFVGIKEKQFVCRIEQDGMSKTLEMRYNTATQKWRIFQFL